MHLPRGILHLLFFLGVSTAAASSKRTEAPTSGTPLQVWPCNASSALQSWSFDLRPFPHHNVRLGGATAGLPYTGLNLNTLGFSNATGGVLNVWTDSPTNPYGQFWAWQEGQLTNLENDLCAGTTNSSGVLPAGTAVVQVDCSSGPAAAFSYDNATGLLRWGMDDSLCLDAGTSFSCDAYPSQGSALPPYCNTSLSATVRAADLLERMLPSERAAFLSASNNGVPRLGVPPLRYGEALHGVLSPCGAAAPPTPSGFASTGCPTSFPTGLALGSSFNRSLWKAVGAVIGREARALFNQQQRAQLMLFTPDLNAFRDPRWGRGMEVPGEDPVLSGEYGAQYVLGLQGEEGGAPYLTAVAMPKHFSVYDQEGNGGAHDRTHFCAPTDLASLVSYFWAPFKAALQRGRAGGLMCACSGYGYTPGSSGQPSCSRSEINNGVLRGQWGWEGAMVTDGNGVGDLWDHYGPNGTALNCGGTGAAGPTGAVRVGLRGGVDVELGETLNNFALPALADGNISMGDIEAALERTLPFIFRLGLMDAQSPLNALGAGDVDTEGARALALEAAAQAVVLLRNDNGLLPLAPLAGKVAVVGPSAADAGIQLANYHGENRLAALHTPLAALQRAVAARPPAANATLAFAPGCATVLCPDASGFAGARGAAEGAGVVLFFCGGAPWRGGAGAFNSTEGEEFDREGGIGLPGQQEALLGMLLDMAESGAGGAVVVVVQRGGPIGLSPPLLARVRTLVDVAYPGELGGEGIAGVLLGRFAPSGRLSTTVYPPAFVATRNITDYNFSSGEGVTHLYYTGTPQFPFGFGASTTTWNLTWFSAAAAAAAAASSSSSSTGSRVQWLPGAASSGAPLTPPPPFAVNVSNTGGRVSDISLLAFLHYPEPRQPGQPLQKLFDFARAAAVAPGETVTLFFTVPPEVAATYADNGEGAVVAGEVGVRIGAPGESMLQGVFEVVLGEGQGQRLVVSPAPPLL